MAKLFAGFGVLWLLVALVGVIAWIHGIVLAFSASVLLGIICIFLEVPFVFFGLAYWITGVDFAQRLVDAFPGLLG